MAQDARSAGARDYFFSLVEEVSGLLRGDEVSTCYLRGEESSFVRFNHGRVRQAGDVSQRQIDVDLIRGRRHAVGQVGLSGDRTVDRHRLGALVAHLREVAASSPEDPYLAYNTDVSASGERWVDSALPRPEEVVESVDRGVRGADLVGIYAAGRIDRGFASSLGQRNWHSSHSFNFDWSVFPVASASGAAVKASYAGFVWDRGDLHARIDASIDDLRLLARPPRVLEPGRIRAYLAPAAVHELFSILAWGGFSARARMTKVSPLLRLHGGTALAPQISVEDNVAGGATPAFDPSGFPRPDRVRLIAAGRAAACLTSARSAREYAIESNGADEDEAPSSLELAPGGLDREQIVAELHRGLVISNLWYLNFSDRAACRVTGMTRFASLWVEHGRVVGPVAPMRFDDSVYRMLGDHLVGLTRQRDWIMDPGTYEWRSTRTALLPGLLIDDFTLTL